MIRFKDNISLMNYYKNKRVIELIAGSNILKISLIYANKHRKK